jgi:hypothetical protein
MCYRKPLVTKESPQPTIVARHDEADQEVTASRSPLTLVLVPLTFLISPDLPLTLVLVPLTLLI